MIFWCLYICWRQNCFTYSSWTGKHWRRSWFLYDGDLCHERIKQLHALKQVSSVTRALQTCILVLLKKIVSNINLKTLTISAEGLGLVVWLVQDVSLHVDTTISNGDMKRWKTSKGRIILINYLHLNLKS